MATPLDPKRVQDLLATELERFEARTPRSLEISRRAVESLPGGVGSGVAVADPYPLIIEDGQGGSVVDVDGNAYVDYCGGFRPRRLVTPTR